MRAHAKDVLLLVAVLLCGWSVLRVQALDERLRWLQVDTDAANEAIRLFVEYPGGR